MSLAWWGAPVELLPSLSGKTEMSQHLDGFLWHTLKLFIYLCSCWLLLVSKSFEVAAAGCLVRLSVNFSTNSCTHKRPNCIEQSIQPQPELPRSCSAILVRHSKQMPLAWGIVSIVLYGDNSHHNRWRKLNVWSLDRNIGENLAVQFAGFLSWMSYSSWDCVRLSWSAS